VVAVLLTIPASILAGLVLSVPAPGCARARALYESLDLEKAVEVAQTEAAKNGDPACLEVKALALLVLGQMDGARAALEDLFAKAPDYAIDDPSLSPALKDTIRAVRESVRSLTASVRANWLIHESVRLDVLLDGGLRDATKVRYTAETSPAAERHSGEIRLLGRAATATVAVVTPAEVTKLHVSGAVLNDADRILARFDSELGLPGRPVAREEKVIEVDSGPGWPLWLGVALAAVGAAAAVVILAQPHLPDTGGTVGRVNVNP
jgi:hypothetical protein